ncbi:ankyrin repeat domain-containing protein [Legionella sp. D16C41]|uniref:ankyrin repeat domain-containing protein n=1 Tax=Legionella sp. D16C41 TaxID=3402688 RepID=UPI003AF81976
MSVHQALLDLYHALNYPKIPGLCHGFSRRWLEASLLSPEEQLRLEKRIDLITTASTSDLVKAIEQAKAKKGKNKTEFDEELLDILSFYDSLILLQRPYPWSYLINKPYIVQSDFEGLSSAASAIKILQVGGLQALYSDAFVTTEVETKEYLDNLSKQLDIAAGLSKEPIGILLEGEGHTVALLYTPGQGFQYRDINPSSINHNKSPTTEQVAAAIMQSCNPKKITPYITFNVQVVLPRLAPQYKEIQYQLDKFKQTHKITKEIAFRKANAANLIHFAAKYGHAKMLEELARFGINVNQTNINGDTPAMIAAEHNQTEALEVLAKNNADLEQRCNGKTPVWSVVEKGYVKALEILAKYKVDLNQAYNGEPLVWMAAKKGYADILEILIKHKVNLNQTYQGIPLALGAVFNGHAEVVEVLAKYNSLGGPADDGTTLAIIAAEYGHANIMKVLVKYNVNLNEASNNNTTPVLIAAYNGHANVMKVLAENKTNLDQANSAGETAVLIAAQKGHAAVIDVLAQHKANLNKADKSGITPVWIAAQYGHTEVIKILTHYLDRADLNQKTDGVTPLFIAAQNNRRGVVESLLKAGADYTIALKCTAGQLRWFATSINNNEVIRRMAEFLGNVPANTNISVMPHEMAKIMGHEEVAKIIEQHAALESKVKQNLNNDLLLFSNKRNKDNIETASIQISQDSAPGA